MSQAALLLTDAARQVEAERADLRDALGAIQKHFSDGPASATWVSEKLAALGDQLINHFRAEEEGGFFSEVVERDQRFASDAAQLQGEHTAMLGEFQTLLSETRRGANPSEWWDNAKDRFHAFSRQLMRHESDENRLLQSAYWDDIGSKD
jgi:iron-sulfur cluster repair protein YtfE (RIC family)